MKIIINKIIRLYHLLNIFIVYVQKRGIGTYHKVLGFFTAPFFMGYNKRRKIKGGVYGTIS